MHIPDLAPRALVRLAGTLLRNAALELLAVDLIAQRDDYKERFERANRRAFERERARDDARAHAAKIAEERDTIAHKLSEERGKVLEIERERDAARESARLQLVDTSKALGERNAARMRAADLEKERDAAVAARDKAIADDTATCIAFRQVDRARLQAEENLAAVTRQRDAALADRNEALAAYQTTKGARDKAEARVAELEAGGEPVARLGVWKKVRKLTFDEAEAKVFSGAGALPLYLHPPKAAQTETAIGVTEERFAVLRDEVFVTLDDGRETGTQAEAEGRRLHAGGRLVRIVPADSPTVDIDQIRALIKNSPYVDYSSHLVILGNLIGGAK